MSLEKQIFIEKKDTQKEDKKLQEDLVLINNFLNSHIVKGIQEEESEKTILESEDEKIIHIRESFKQGIKELNIDIKWIDDATSTRSLLDKDNAFEHNKVAVNAIIQ